VAKGRILVVDDEIYIVHILDFSLGMEGYEVVTALDGEQALERVAEQKPDLILDFATLTGAARVALGPELPALFANRDEIADALLACARETRDPLWRLPLWAPYDAWLDSKVANINNAPSGTFAGSITCALFLQRFVEHAKSWLHVDIYAWTPQAKPARPEGGECQAARAIYKLLGERYA